MGPNKKKIKDQKEDNRQGGGLEDLEDEVKEGANKFQNHKCII